MCVGDHSKKVSQMLMGSKRKLSGAAVQRYYPQCSGCSSKQSSAVKMGRDILVFHYYGIRPWYYAGAHCIMPLGVSRFLSHFAMHRII